MIITQGIIAQVRAIEDEGHRLYIEYRNGAISTYDSDEPFDFSVGDVVHIQEWENRINIVSVPDEIEIGDSWIGVVRLKEQDTTVVDCNGILRKFPTRDSIAYQIGNTVEARDSYGVVLVLSEGPIKSLEPPEDDEAIITKFKIDPDTIQETFEDFGGFRHVIERARELIEVPMRYKTQLAEIGARPIKGVLFTGPPGTGKTMLAKIIAKHSGASFYEISGPEVFSKWYGESEKIIRALFDDAAKQDQAIIFFDEIDSVAGQRAEETHEASRRVVAQLLTLMDGFTKSSNVIVIAATNRPQDIDAALRRPGRFDWEVNFSLPDRADRESILQASAHRLKTMGILPHAWVAQRTESWSAAELAAIWSEAALLAATDERAAIIVEDYIGGFERVSSQRNLARRASIGGVAT